MPTYSTHDVVLVTYPFSDVSTGKVRPAVVVSAAHASHDLFVVPLTSRTSYLLAGEFVLGDWAAAGLNVPSAAKRGVYTIHESLVIKRIGQLTTADGEHLRQSLRQWFGLR
jgi:mRNA interferase MazF